MRTLKVLGLRVALGLIATGVALFLFGFYVYGVTGTPVNAKVMPGGWGYILGGVVLFFIATVIIGGSVSKSTTSDTQTSPPGPSSSFPEGSRPSGMGGADADGGD